MTRFALTLAFFSLVLSTQLPAKAFQQTNPTRAKTIEESQRKANQKEQEKQKQAKAKANEKLTPEELATIRAEDKRIKAEENAQLEKALEQSDKARLNQE